MKCRSRRESTTCAETEIFDITENDLGSLVIREVINCTGGLRTIEVTRGATTITIPTEGSSLLLDGIPVVGSYSVRRTLVFPEECPPPFEVVPRPERPLPPPICMIFLAGCDPSDSCHDG